jgi:hypothetical protein
MTAPWLTRFWLAGALLIGPMATGRAQTAPDPAAGAWFVPPPVSAAPHATVDMTLLPGSETITIIAKRPSRSWRSTVAAEHLNDPRNSDAARPDKTFTTEKPYCNSALRTVGGQPANAAETAVGSGAGGC